MPRNGWQAKLKLYLRFHERILRPVDLFNNCFHSDPEASSVSQHPAHLVDAKDTLMPSALIPFCSLQTNLSMLGTDIPNFSFPVCTAFQPRVLHGRLCYTLDLPEVVKGTSKAKTGKANGIMIVVDPNKERSETGRTVDQIKMQKGKQFLNLSPKSAVDSSAHIYIHTLQTFQVYGEGSFALRSLKKMTATQAFLNQKDKRKNCQKEELDACLMRRYMENGLRKCDCLPWSFGSALSNNVSCFHTRSYPKPHSPRASRFAYPLAMTAIIKTPWNRLVASHLAKVSMLTS